MLTRISASEIMTKNVITISSSDNLWEIERIFRINHLRHAPVCEEGELVGMISLIDLRRYFPSEDGDGMPNENIKDLTASQIMASDPISIQANQTVKEAAEMVAENEFHALPVLEGNNLVGIVSTTDIIRYLIEAIEDLPED